MRTPAPPTICLVSLLVAGVALAQLPQVDQSQLFNPPPGEQVGPSEERPPSEFSATGLAPSSPGDSDLGEQVILKRQPKATPFIFTLNCSINYTSNIALLDRNARGDAFFLTQAALTYQYKIRDNIILDTGVSEGIFRYDKYTAFGGVHAANFVSFANIFGLFVLGITAAAAGTTQPLDAQDENETAAVIARGKV